MTGIVNLFCPICGALFVLDQNKPQDFGHSKELRQSERKSARIILGKNEAGA